MKHGRMKYRLIAGLAGLALAVVAAQVAKAGGPLATFNNQPVLWASRTIQGGPLNSRTVQINDDGSRTIFYHVDDGNLGPLQNAEAVALVEEIFTQYNAIRANINFQNAGPILHPVTRQPVDINGSNFNSVAGANSRTLQNPIIFDSDGSITGTGGVLGFAGIMSVDTASGVPAVAEGVVVLNGTALQGALALTPASFLGVFTHEFGHFAGPLDHAQINGYIALSGADASIPPGFNDAQLYDVFAPFTETMFPFLFDAPFGGSDLSDKGFPDSGFFVATLDLDTKNAMKNLYPSPANPHRATDPGSDFGAIEGSVVIRTLTGDVPVNGINVVARRIDRGAYPPSPATAVFNATIDFAPTPAPTDGKIPIVPEKLATDPLETASSALTGYPIQAGVSAVQGAYKIDGLPPGDYLIEIQTVLPQAIDGSSIGPLGTQFPLLVQEFYNGLRESGDASDDPADFTPVAVTRGQVTSGINIVLNGFSNAGLIAAVEDDVKNNKLGKAPLVQVPADVTGSVASTDAGKLKVIFSNNQSDKIEDIFKIQLDRQRRVFVVLEPINDTADLDLYLFNGNLTGKKVRTDDSRLLDASLSGGSFELMARTLPAGTYYIGLSAFSGNDSYRLRIYLSD